MYIILHYTVLIHCHQLIVTKFQYPNDGDVNYVAFIQAIDEEYTGQAMEQDTPRYVLSLFSTVICLGSVCHFTRDCSRLFINDSQILKQIYFI